MEFSGVMLILITIGADFDQCFHRFHAKISYADRDDHMCFWVAREDFFKLETFIQAYDIFLHSPLPFVAYRGKIGISREFCSWDSHNGVQALLICTYLADVDSLDEIDVLDMYAKYVRAWNGDADEKSPYSLRFKSSSAQEFLILLETLDVLITGSQINDDHLLLNGDEQLWRDIGWAKNWYEVGRKRLKRRNLLAFNPEL